MSSEFSDEIKAGLGLLLLTVNVTINIEITSDNYFVYFFRLDMIKNFKNSDKNQNIDLEHCVS